MSIERIIFLLMGLRRHWLLLLLPLVVAAPIAVLIWKATPTRYEAKSTILLLSANRGADFTGGASGFPRQNAVEQIAVLEAWLKSDHVLGELLPQLVDGPAPTSPEAISALTSVFRRTLSLQLIGAGVLEIQLAGSQAKGLGRKLEAILARLMEGVLNPEAGILSSVQLVIAHRQETAQEAEAALSQAIANAGLESPERVKAQLQALRLLKQNRQPNNSGLRMERTSTREPGSAMSPIDEARAAISSDPKVVATLESLFDIAENAHAALQQIRDKGEPSATSYVRVFDAPERLTVIGRPRDPLMGTSPGRKYAIAIMLLAILGSLGLVGLVAILDPRLRVREDFEAIAELPVVARLGRLRRSK
jgi:capsular polysaccharide biosynthesis protein